MYWIKVYSIFIGLFFFSQSTLALDESIHPWSIGVSGGIGSTTWEGLIPKFNNKNESLSLFTPIKTNEGGGVWGLFFGYDLTPSFGLEANYMHYPNATILFNQDSLFAYNHDDQVILNSRTDTAFLFAKIMMPFPRTHLRAYSGAGVAGVHRSDVMNNQWVASPIFTLGISNNITPCIMAALEAHYIAGRGEVELEPSADYIPFLYAIYLKIAYRFSV